LADLVLLTRDNTANISPEVKISSKNWCQSVYLKGPGTIKTHVSVQKHMLALVLITNQRHHVFVMTYFFPLRNKSETLGM